MSDWWDIVATLPAEFDQPGSIPPAPKIGTSPVKPTDANKLWKNRRDNLRAYLQQLFRQVQLPEALADWALSVIIEGASGAELSQRLYLRPEFKTRFRAIFERQKAGRPAISPQEVIAYERAATQLMRSAGMPPGFYDHPDDFVALQVNDIGMTELGERVNQGFERVISAPREVREAFTAFFGPSGDAALASMFLDPTKALPALRQQVGAAEVAGAGFSFGFRLDRTRSMDIAARGFDYESAAQRFSNLVQTQPLFAETISETTDLQVEEEGAAAVFGLTGAGEALNAIERRGQERSAAFEGGGGAQGSISSGARGLGASQ